MATAFYKKDTADCEMGDGLISRKAILKYRHGSLTMGYIVHRFAHVDTD